MAFFDMLMFWKKKDDLGDLGMPEGPRPDFGLDSGLGRERDLGLGADRGPGFPGTFEEPPQNPGFGQPAFMQNPFQQQQFQQPAMQQQQSPNDYIISKNIEILSSKLDALRVGIESINQRLAHLERIASGEHEERRRGW